MEKGALPHPFGLKLPLPGSPTDNSKQCDHLARSKRKFYQLSPEKAAFRMWPKLRIFVLFDIEETPLPFRFIGESPEALFAI